MSDSSADRNPLDPLAEEFVARFRAGERPSLTEYAQRHPELADDIRELFPALVEMEQLKPVSADNTGAFVSSGDDTVPDRIGEFRILRQVGRGGMGVVYEAMQESLGRHVALKVLPAETLMDPKRRERFRREARSAARLHHTNIVPVFGTGEADGRHFYAMQFIYGHPLDAVIDEVRRLREKSGVISKGRAADVAQSLMTGTFAQNFEPMANRPEPDALARVVTPTLASASGSGRGETGSSSSHLTDQPQAAYARAVARIGAQAADALAYAHAQGILHRDVKPSNLLLDHRGTVWVTDFGLAKADDSENLTQDGDMVGTLRYMAPERFDGQGDQRADVYALGLTLYELLTLRPAYAAEARGKLVEQVLATTPPAPRLVNPAIPRDLQTIVQKAIERVPDDRYATASELAEDLRRFVEDEPIKARRTSTVERAWRWCRRNPALAGMIAAVILVAAGGFAANTYQTAVAREHARRADRGEQRAIEGAKNLAVTNQELEKRTDEIRGLLGRVANDRDRMAALNSQLNTEQYANHMALIPVAWNGENYQRVLRLLELHRPRIGENDQRGFEWNYHKRNVHGEIAAQRLQTDGGNWLAGPNGPGNAGTLLLSADGTRVVSLTPAGLVAWDVATGQRLPTPSESTDPGNTAQRGRQSSAAVSRDGKRFAGVAPGARGGAAAKGGKGKAKGPSTLSVREVDSGRVLFSEPMSSNTTFNTPLYLSPDGTRFAVIVALPGGVRGAAAITGMELEIYDLTAAHPTPRHAKAVGSLSGIRMVAITSDNRRLIFSGSVPSDEQLPIGVPIGSPRTIVIDTETGEQLPDLKMPADASLAAISPDGTRLAVASLAEETRSGAASLVRDTYDLSILDAATGDKLGLVLVPQGVRTFCFSPDGKLLAGFGNVQSSVVHVWDIPSGIERHAIRGQTARVDQVAFNADGTRLVTLDAEGTVKTWDLTRLPERAAMPPRPNLVGRGGRGGFQIAPDARRSLTGQFQSNVAAEKAINHVEYTVHDENNAALARYVGPAPQSRVNGPVPAGLPPSAISPDGSKFAVLEGWSSAVGPARAADDAPVETWVIWDVATNKQLCRLEPLDGQHISASPNAFAFSADGRLFALADNSSRQPGGENGQAISNLTVWDATNGGVILDRRLDFTPNSLGFSPNMEIAVGGSVVAPMLVSTIRMFSLSDSTARSEITLPRRRLNYGILTYSPDGRWLAATASRAAGLRGLGVSVGDTPEIYVWDTENEEREPQILAGHVSGIADLRFTPDSRRLASLGRAQGNRSEIKLWDPDTGAELLTLPERSVPTAIRFSADGYKLYVFDDDGRRAYDATPLPPSIEAIDIADTLELATTRAEVVAQLDKLALSPELKAKAAEMARLSTAGGPGGGIGGRPGGQITNRAGQPKAYYEQIRDLNHQQITADANDAIAWRDYAGALYRLEDYKLALEACLRAKELRANTIPDSAQPLISPFLAMTYYKLGRLNEAKATLEEIRQAPAWEPPALGRELLAEAEMLIEGKTSTPTSRGRGGDSPQTAALTTISLPDRPEAEYRQVLAAAEIAKTVYPDAFEGWRDYSGALYRLKRYDEALVAIKTTIEVGEKASLVPRHMMTAFLAMTYYRLGRMDEAKAELAKLRGAEVGSPDKIAILAEAAALIEGKK